MKRWIFLLLLLTACSSPGGQFSGFWDKTDFETYSVPPDQFRSGGVPPDGIPPIDNPRYEPISEAEDWLQAQSPILAVEVDGDARAYPLAILTRHEIANTTIGGVPAAVTFCPLCNSGIVFERRLEDGTILRMGVSGLLRNSDLVMWDDQTQSWWQQFTGEALVGSLTGTQLDMIPSTMVSFGAFAQQYPQGMVLSRSGAGYSERSYGGNPYPGYDSSSRPFLFDGDLDNRLPATERVLAGVIGGEATAYPFRVLRERQVINHTVGGVDVVAIWQPGATSALDGNDIDNSRDVGMAALYRRELNGQNLTFTSTANGTITDEQTNSTWNVFGTAIAGELAGAQLRQELAAPHFWFAWHAFEPDTILYGIE